MRRAALVVAAAIAALSPLAARAGGTTAEVDAAARAAGNRRPDAVALGQTLFMQTRPAQLLKIRIDGHGDHEVAGLLVSGVKFHGPLDRSGFEGEILDLVRRSFAASRVEEVDCWATVPLPPEKREIVTGDMAQPTTKIVFAVTVRRTELAAFAQRLRAGRDVYWDPAFQARLTHVPRQGAGAPGAQS